MNDQKKFGTFKENLIPSPPFTPNYGTFWGEQPKIAQKEKSFNFKNLNEVLSNPSVDTLVLILGKSPYWTKIEKNRPYLILNLDLWSLFTSNGGLVEKFYWKIILIP